MTQSHAIQDEHAVQTGVVLIPLNKLKKSPKNARTAPHSKAEIEALAASIHVKGMLQNLVVEPELDEGGARTGFYLVQIGEGRRLAQLRVRRKQIQADHARAKRAQRPDGRAHSCTRPPGALCRRGRR